MSPVILPLDAGQGTEGDAKMHVKLALTPAEAEAIDTAWSRWERYDNPQIGKNCGYATIPGGSRWLDDNGDLSEIQRDADGNWTFRYQGSRNGAAAFHAEGVDWKRMPILVYYEVEPSKKPRRPWWQRDEDPEKEAMLNFTQTDLHPARVYDDEPDVTVRFDNGLGVHVWRDEPYWFMTYFLDGAPVATRMVTDYRREMVSIMEDRYACRREMEAFRNA